jgi:Holliday junction DNA helicase RuvA
LTGIIVEQGLDGTCILDVSGVGYELHVPLGALGRLLSARAPEGALRPQAPERTTLFVHTHLREDALTLYGFASEQDRAAFRVLTSVTGIGPKLALGILSALSAEELADAINRGDRNRFKGVSGVGKKLVERLVLELKDKLPMGGASVLRLPVRAVPVPALSGALGTVHGALVQMGFKPAEAERAVEQIKAEASEKPTEELLREALTHLA